MVRPAFSILADGQNITSLIKDRLLSLSITDQAGVESDLMTLTLDDRDHKIALPAHGAELECYLGYEDTPLDRIGLYVVDEVTLASPPATLTIRAHAADMRQSLKSSRNQTYDAITLGELLSTIANRHGLEPKISDGLAAIYYDPVNQIKESDINLLTRLAKEQDAITSVKGGKLIIAPKSKGQTLSGQSLSPVTLSQNELTSWRVNVADREAYQSVAAHYYDSDQAQTITVTAGSDMPQFTIKKSYKDAAEALAAAKAKYQQFQRGTRTLDLTLSYKSGLGAEIPIVIENIREGIDGDWIIDEARHDLSSQGLTTRLAATPKP